MSQDNILEFSVEGVGTFKVYKEAPAYTQFVDRRNELSRMIGGRKTLIELETAYQRIMGKKVRTEDDLELANSIAYELLRLNAIIDLKTLVVEVPKGFSVDTMSQVDFEKVFRALIDARSPFRGEGADGTAIPVVPVGAAGQRGPDSVEGVSKAG